MYTEVRSPLSWRELSTHGDIGALVLVASIAMALSRGTIPLFGANAEHGIDDPGGERIGSLFVSEIHLGILGTSSLRGFLNFGTHSAKRGTVHLFGGYCHSSPFQERVSALVAHNDGNLVILCYFYYVNFLHKENQAF
jgi:hypothetical protein